MKNILFIVGLLCLCFKVQAGNTLTGKVVSSDHMPVANASVALLSTTDSTLLHFAISNAEGAFSINNLADNKAYLLQIASLGYYTYYKSLTVNNASLALGTIILETNVQKTTLDDIVVSGEKIPIQLKGDTLEYNASSFAVKPDANVEDLLRKLPGVQVDENGNIKSMGKNVTKVLVDGEEFFGNDPKMATRNLPADAVGKIQAFEKKSEESLFSGIDDGAREQTINLLLKQGKKRGYFGNAEAGIGNDNKFDLNLKAFQFSKKSQLALIGMYNNINKYGFSISDYINFTGGISSLLQNGDNELRLDPDEVPIDVGITPRGAITSGAMGLNYSTALPKKGRISVNYLGTGVHKKIQESTHSENFLENNTFTKEDSSRIRNKTYVNNLSGTIRSTIAGNTLLLLKGQAKNTDLYNMRRGNALTIYENIPYNTLERRIATMDNTLSLSALATLTTKTNHNSWKQIQNKIAYQYSNSTERSKWLNETGYPLNNLTYTDKQFQYNHSRKNAVEYAWSATCSHPQHLFSEPRIRIAAAQDNFSRQQGLLATEPLPVDSLSPRIVKEEYGFLAGYAFKKLSRQLRWHINADAQQVIYNTTESGSVKNQQAFTYFLPSAYWFREIRQGRQLSLNYKTGINTPSVNQLLTYTDYSNPLQLFKGNAGLIPEYVHNLTAHYNVFNAFDMTSFYIMLNTEYRRHAIHYSRTINSNFAEMLQWVNTDYSLRLGLNGNYTFLLKRPGISTSVSLKESYTETLLPVNNVNNINKQWNQVASIEMNTQKTKKWDAILSAGIDYTQSYFSIDKNLDNRYTNYSGKIMLNYRPSGKWNIGLGLDYKYYTARTFKEPVSISIVKAEISRYILKYDRGCIKLSGFDLFNQNQYVIRSGQMNYLLEQRSNTIGRYVMLSFNYRLSKLRSNSNLL